MMAKLSRKELRRELKEVMLPVISHLHDIIENGRGSNVLDYEHNGEKFQAQFHGSDNGLTVYVMYWHGLTIAFKFTPEELATASNNSVEWHTNEFVKINEVLIGRAYRSKPTLH